MTGKSLKFIHLATAACLVASQASPAFAKPTETDEQKAARERAELQDAQANMARAYADYYKALKGSGAKANTDALQAQFLGPAQDQMTGLMHKRRQESDKMIYGKVYFSDGTIMDAKQFEADPRSKAYAQEDASSKEGATEDHEEEAEAPAKEKSKAKVETVSNGSGNPSGGASASPGFSSSPNGAFKRPEWVLDGSNIPKEIVFESGSAAPEPHATKEDKKASALKKLRAPASVGK